jgi:hypothetical protein
MAKQIKSGRGMSLRAARAAGFRQNAWQIPQPTEVGAGRGPRLRIFPGRHKNFNFRTIQMNQKPLSLV